MRKTLMILVFLALFVPVYAEDLNAADEPLNAVDESMAAITPDELQEALAQIRLETQAARAQVVTVRMDTETRQLFDRLEDKMVSLEQKLAVIEDRFMILKNDMADKIDSSATSTKAGISEAVDKRMVELMAATQQYVRDMTNPIRINLPNFGLWLMVTSAFMLTAGLRMKSAVKDAKAEIAKNKKGGKNAR